MKLTDTLLFSFAVLTMLIGIHQSMTLGFMYGYWLFMISSGLLLWYTMRKKKQKAQETSSGKETDKAKPDKKRKYKF